MPDDKTYLQTVMEKLLDAQECLNEISEPKDDLTRYFLEQCQDDMTRCLANIRRLHRRIKSGIT